MKPKILFTASIPLHFIAFHTPYFEWFHNLGFEVHTAANGTDDLPFVHKQWDVGIQRSPYSLKNKKAYRQLKEIINSQNYTIISCHTPVASILTRLAARTSRKNGSKVLYTAHGFHFYNGAPFLHWILFYPIEMYLSKYADAIITINDEDFQRIKLKGSKKTDYFKIPGIGVNGQRFFPLNRKDKETLKMEKEIPQNKIVFVYAAEFIPRKNHKFLIDAIHSSKEVFQNSIVLFAGNGVLEKDLKFEVKKKGLHEIILFLGFRNDINEIYQLGDIGISSSKQEGLGLNLIEAMMCGLPVIATEDRGHCEIIDHGINGFLFPHGDKLNFINSVKKLIENEEEYSRFSLAAIEKAEKFEIKNSLKIKGKIFKKYL